MRQTDNKALLLPVSNFAAIGGAALKDAIVWLPVKEVADVITALVQLRQQLIQDVYEITGLSDIMRGSTVASETATAQNLKAQYGSVRVRERQSEMVRIAHDVICIKAEILAETVPVEELALIAGMQLPTSQDMQAQMLQARQAAAQGQPAPEMPDPADVVTMEQVGELLASQKIRPFVLDIETDSTIAPNEAEEKASRIEFVTAVGQFMTQALPMASQLPEAAPFLGEMLKFTAAGFRAGRQLGGAIDDLVEQIKAKAATPPQQQPDPAVLKVEADKEAKQAELQLAAQRTSGEMQVRQAELTLKSRELDIKEREGQAKADADMAAQGLPPGYNFAAHQQEMAALAAGVTQGQQQMAQALQVIGAGLAQVMQTMRAPKVIHRDEAGNVVAVEAAGVVQPVQRTTDGRIAGIG